MRKRVSCSISSRVKLPVAPAHCSTLSPGCSGGGTPVAGQRSIAMLRARPRIQPSGSWTTSRSGFRMRPSWTENTSGIAPGFPYGLRRTLPYCARLVVAQAATRTRIDSAAKRSIGVDLRLENAPSGALFNEKRFATVRRCSGDVFLVRRGGLFRAEQLAHLFQEGLGLRVRLLPGERGKLLEQLALLAGELLRDLHGYPYVLVAALIPV